MGFGTRVASLSGMQPPWSKDAHVRALIDAAIAGQLTESQAEELSALGQEVAKLALLLTTRRIAEQDARIAQLEGRIAVAGAVDPSTPSGQRPIYTKPAAPKRRGKPGARAGHPGTHRPAPQRIDRREEHSLERCPDCGGELHRCKRTRTRTVENILADLRTEVTEHTIHRDYCPRCKKHVEPVVGDALPKAAIGNNLVALTGWLHYGLGVTMAQVRELVGIHLYTP